MYIYIYIYIYISVAMLAQACLGSSLCLLSAAAAMPYKKRKAEASLPRLRRGMHTFVKFANGHGPTLEVKPSDTINIVKAKITEYMVGQLRPDQQRLIFAEHHNLLNGRTLSDYNIRHGATLHCCRAVV